MESEFLLELSFSSTLSPEILYTKTVKWLESRWWENEDPFKYNHYWIIYSSIPNEEIQFGVKTRTASVMHSPREPSIIKFKADYITSTKITLQLAHVYGEDVTSNPRIEPAHDYAFEIMEGILGELTSEQLRTMYPEEYLIRRLKQKQNWNKLKAFFILIFILIPIFNSILLNVVSIAVLSAFLVNHYWFGVEPHTSLRQMKKELYGE